MSDNNVQIVNRDGKLIGVDPETGDTVPIEIDETSIGQASIGSVVTEEDPVFNVKAYGAVGDGSTDDTQAIQDTINAAESNGGGVIFLPRGSYYITSQIVVRSSNISLVGAGRYQSLIKPEYVSDSSNRIGNWLGVSASDDSTLSNFEIRNLGIDGTEARDDYDANGDVITGDWATIAFRDCRNIAVENIFADTVKHVVDARDCENIQYTNWHYTECFNGPSIIRCNDVQVDGMVAKRVSTIIDLGVCENVTVSQLNGTCNDYTEEEAIDCGGSMDVKFENIFGRNFATGMLIKGENDEGWEDIVVKNASFTGLTNVGISLTPGSAQGEVMSNPTLHGVTLESDSADVNGIEIRQEIQGLDVIEPNINVSGNGIFAEAANNVTITGGSVHSSGGSAIFLKGLNGERLGSPVVRGVDASSDGSTSSVGAIHVTEANDPKIIDCGVRSPSRSGINLRNSLRATAVNNDIYESYSDGIRIRLTSSASVDSTQQSIGHTVDNNVIRDFAQNGDQRAIYFEVDPGETSGSYDGASISSNRILLSEDATTDTQVGIEFNAGDLDSIDYIKCDDNLILDVPTPISGESDLGSNSTQDNMTKST